MDFVKKVKGKILRKGFTTGSCATAAAKAAATKLLCGQSPGSVSFKTPQNVELSLPIYHLEQLDCAVRASVLKDAGDDPDITNGMEVVATVSKIPQDLVIRGGQGVGVVTKPGLDQPVGAAAINSGPRLMLELALREVAAAAHYTGGLEVVISLPQGEELAKKTFNPRLGIQGGLSIIGTTGIVEPMSHQALLDTIHLEIRQLAAQGATQLILIFGNYSKDFLANTLGIKTKKVVVCSNFVRDSLELAAEEGFRKIFLLGHIGKFVKLALGMPNTHSDYGDGRIEALILCALRAGANRKLLLAIADCATTDAALYLLQEQGLLAASMQELGQAVHKHLQNFTPANVQLEFMFFTNKEGLPGELYRSPGAAAWLIKTS